MVQRRVRFGVLLLALLVAAGSFSAVTAEEHEEHKKNQRKSLLGTVIGIGLVSGGSIYSVLEYAQSKKSYSSYRKSAFTDNTEKLRRDTGRHDRNCAIGAAVAGLGAFCILVNF